MDVKEENGIFLEDDESDDAIGNRRSDIKQKAFRNAVRLSPRSKGLAQKTDSDDQNHSTKRSQKVYKRRYRKRNRVRTVGRPRKYQCSSSESEDEEISPKRPHKAKRPGRVARKNTLAPFNDDVAPPTAQQVMDWANDKTLTIHMD